MLVGLTDLLHQPLPFLREKEVMERPVDWDISGLSRFGSKTISVSLSCVPPDLVLPVPKATRRCVEVGFLLSFVPEGELDQELGLLKVWFRAATSSGATALVILGSEDGFITPLITGVIFSATTR